MIQTLDSEADSLQTSSKDVSKEEQGFYKRDFSLVRRSKKFEAI